MTVNGALYGGTLNPVSRIGDLENTISIGTAGAFLARDLFKESIPYYKEYNDTGLVIYITYHFLRELRRQLSGNIVDGTSTLSPEETTFYNEYQEYQDGVIKQGELLLACISLDTWLVDEVQGKAHPILDRDYSITHPWSKTLVREVPWP